MTHYDIQMWIKYYNQSTDETTKYNMEDHMLICDQCLEKYTSIIEANGFGEINDIIPIHFSTEIVENIKAYNEIQNWKINYRKRKFINSVIYYVAVASITLFFLYNGIFNSLTINLTDNTSNIMKSTSKIEQIVANGWSERLMNKTTGIIDTLISKQ